MSAKLGVKVDLVDDFYERGVLTTRAYKAGEAILTEHALVSLQTLDNMAEAAVCAHCYHFLGTLDFQTRIVTGETSLFATDSLPSPTGPLAVDESNSLTESIVPCIHGCGQKYCSDKCRDAALSLHHGLLCVGLCQNEDDPLVHFKRHAFSTNEIFTQVARSILLLFGEYERIATTTVSAETNSASLLDEAMRLFPYKMIAWEDAVFDEEEDGKGNGDNGPSEGEEFSLQEQLRSLTTESFALLQSAWPVDKFVQRSSLAKQLVDDFYAKTMTLEFFSGLIGAFERNQVALTIPNPLSALLESLQAQAPVNDARRVCLEAVQAVVKEQNSHHIHSGEEDDEDEDGEHDPDDAEENQNEEEAGLAPAFPHFRGQALFPHVCMMNHSCTPNCRVVFAQGSEQKDSAYTATPSISRLPVATLIAAVDIAEGEQLTNSYLSEEELTFPVQDRRDFLRDYGFICMCQLCVKQQSDADI